MGFLLDKVALGQVLLPILIPPTALKSTSSSSSSGPGTIGHIVPDVPSGLSLTPPQETNKRKETDRI
jgi:hypothetical protein